MLLFYNRVLYTKILVIIDVSKNSNFSRNGKHNVVCSLLATPSFRVANAQGNTTATAGIADVDKLIQTFKSNHPALATFEEAKDVMTSLIRS